jgi:tetratricopeptide (TPR) repeat protein
VYNTAVDPIIPPDTHHLLAAIGWLELGNSAEADAELEKIRPALLTHPDILEVRWQVYAEQKKWALCLEAAKGIVNAAPERSSGYIQRSYALRRIDGRGMEAARDALSEAVPKFPKEPIIPYNLACYECQLGRLQQAMAFLAKAFAMGDPKSLKLMAMNDPDLKPLWTHIREL